MKTRRITLIISVSFLFLLIGPAPAEAAKLKYSAWIPYWKKTDGVPDALKNLDKLSEVNPFSYEVKEDGTLLDRLKIEQEPWPEFFAAARAKKVKIIPSISWNDDENIHKVLSDPAARAAHISQILQMVKDNQFDGVDLDYENKKADTKVFYSKFIKELAGKLHAAKKILSCTTEARTPLSSRFTVVPKDIRYANDYATLNAYCDQVPILAYDQGNIDIKLNAAKGYVYPYTPVADKEWVKKVILETTKTIKPSKIMLGIPTYGYEYELTPGEKKYSYSRLRSLSFREAADLAKSAGVSPVRNSAGELMFTYATTTSFGYAVRMVWFSDARAALDKINLARTYGLRGAAVFKIDGLSDPLLWKYLK